MIMRRDLAAGDVLQRMALLIHVELINCVIVGQHNVGIVIVI
jgi:hypothetical protein